MGREKSCQDVDRPPPRDLWAIFGDIRGHSRIEDAIMGGAADIVRLQKSDILLVHDAVRGSTPLPTAFRNRSSLPFAGVASCIDDVQELAYRANASLGRCNDALFNASRLLSDKEILYRLLEAQGIFIPARVIARNVSDLQQVLASLDGPLDAYIIKPLVGTESRCVLRPRAGATPATVLAELRQLGDLAEKESIMVMPHVSAGGISREYCLDGVVSGRAVEFCAVHEKTRMFEGYPIHDRAMVTPPRQPLDSAMLDDLLRRFAGAFPLDGFVFHLEARVDRFDRLVPIDLSLRPGGGLIFRSIVESYGIDLRLAHMYCSLGLDGELRRIARQAASTGKITAIAAVFSNGQSQERIRTQMTQVMADSDSGLVTYDLSNVSILDSSSQAIKPDVALCVAATRSSQDALARMEGLARRLSLSLQSELEARATSPPPRGREYGEVRPVPEEGAGNAVEDGNWTVHGHFSEQARCCPDAVALVDRGARLTYRELDERSTLLARHLATRGARLESRIGIHLDRSIDSIVAILAALKAGGCYVPLDTGFPMPRLRHMIEDAGVEILISTSAREASFDGFEASVWIDRIDWEAASSGPDELPGARMAPDNLAYVVYTSGSLGQPKGVAVTHASVTNLVLGQSYIDFADLRCMLQAAPLSFDAATFELWGALLHGRRCALHDERVPSAEGLRRTIESEEVDTAWFTSSLFNMLVDDCPEVLGRLKRVVAGGEALSPNHVRRFRQLYPDTILINGYGPTETTTFACSHDCGDSRDELERVPIGRPLRNTEILILDSDMNPVPPGQPGELFIGGAGLARGYVNRPDLTADRFVPHPSTAGARLYRTGDRVRMRADDRIEFLGRLDRQVKIRGFRIELDEVEHAILRIPGVSGAVASLSENGQGSVLTARVEPAPGAWQPITRDGIRAALAELVPDFLIPNRIEIVDGLRKTGSGKLERSAAAAAPTPAQAEDTRATDDDLDAVERRLMAIWEEVLAASDLGPEDDFFERGGHSLSATRVVARIRDRFGVDIGLRLLFERSRLRDLALGIQALLTERSTPKRDLEEKGEASSTLPAGAAALAIGQARRSRKKMLLASRLAQLSDSEVSRLLQEKRRAPEGAAEGQQHE